MKRTEVIIGFSFCSLSRWCLSFGFGYKCKLSDRGIACGLADIFLVASSIPVVGFFSDLAGLHISYSVYYFFLIRYPRTFHEPPLNTIFGNYPVDSELSNEERVTL